MANPIRIAISPNCGALDRCCIGIKITNVQSFIRELTDAIAKQDGREFGTGRYRIKMPRGIPYVSSGLGRRRGRGPQDYVVRDHNGRMELFLRREFAAPMTGLHVGVRTLEALKGDPDVGQEEIASVPDGTTHVIMNLIARFKGIDHAPTPPSPEVFVSNLAGPRMLRAIMNDSFQTPFYYASEMKEIACGRA